MTDGRFDAYHRWLGIPAHEQPPNHYRLWGLALYEANPDVIESAADRQMAHVRTYQAGKHAEASQKLLNEIATARLDLLDAERKSTYDAQLHQRELEKKRRVAPLRTAQPLEAAEKPSAQEIRKLAVAKRQPGTDRQSQTAAQFVAQPKPVAMGLAPVLIVVIGGAALFSLVALAAIGWLLFAPSSQTPQPVAVVNGGNESMAPPVERVRPSVETHSLPAPPAAPTRE